MSNRRETAKPDPNSETANHFAVSPFGVGDGNASSKDSLQGLRNLIAAEDLSVVFQPIVDVQAPRVYAYEALVRCRIPGFQDPSELFRRAVEEGCTGRLGRMIRELAVPLCAGMPLFLNIHPVELQEPWLVRPDDPLYFHDHAVFLEVTESVPLTHFDLCREVLKELRARGQVHLVVDDLGAGYSNLKNIADLEPRMVKVDRQLVVGIERNPRRRKLVSGIVRLCTDLGAEVVAEGVETPAEFAALKETGVHYMQGYLFGRPAFPIAPISLEVPKLG